MSEPLHLTEENKAMIREFVAHHFPFFGEEEGSTFDAYARFDEAQEEAQRKAHLSAQFQAAMQGLVHPAQQTMNQSLTAITRKAFSNQLATNIYNTSPMFQQLASQGMYQSTAGGTGITIGTGFTNIVRGTFLP